MSRYTPSEGRCVILLGSTETPVKERTNQLAVGDL